MKTNRSKHGRRSAGLEAAIREDIQGQQVRAAAERASDTRRAMKARGFDPKTRTFRVSDRVKGTLADPATGEEHLVGAHVMYCGHDGWFIADLIRIEGACVVRAGGPVNPGNIVRGSNHLATFHMVDFPGPIAWWPDVGIFVVPLANIKRLS